jgi:hypothetical protein
VVIDGAAEPPSPTEQWLALHRPRKAPEETFHPTPAPLTVPLRHFHGRIMVVARHFHGPAWTDDGPCADAPWSFHGRMTVLARSLGGPVGIAPPAAASA